MKQVEVTIMGHGYILGCPEGGETLLATAVASVDREMSAIRDGGKVKARERIAVLAALNVAYQLAELNASRPASAVLHANGTSNPAEVSELDIGALIDRIDRALGDDGQLL